MRHFVDYFNLSSSRNTSFDGTFASIPKIMRERVVQSPVCDDLIEVYESFIGYTVQLQYLVVRRRRRLISCSKQLPPIESRAKEFCVDMVFRR